MEYVGGELELFADAQNWKAYFSEVLAPHLRGRVLEVGAGMGSTTLVLCRGGATHWDCLEPDPGLQKKLADTLERQTWHCPVRARLGLLANLSEGETFDTIIYIDVLEHIAEDGAELAKASRHLAPGGRLIVLSPAFQFLFSEFDAAVGHQRRYKKSTLLALTPQGVTPLVCCYLDSIGLVASLANRVLLRASLPTREQIRVWDHMMVPASRVFDKVVRFGFGRSIMAVWSKA